MLNSDYYRSQDYMFDQIHKNYKPPTRTPVNEQAECEPMDTVHLSSDLTPQESLAYRDDQMMAACRRQLCR